GVLDDPRRSLRGRIRAQASVEAPKALPRLELHPHPLRDRLPLRSAAGRGRGRPGAGRAAARRSGARGLRGRGLQTRIFLEIDDLPELAREGRLSGTVCAWAKPFREGTSQVFHTATTLR